MLNYKTELVEALSEILPTHYELFCDNSTQLPCITYIENNNSSFAEGETVRYSRVSYIVKIWGNDIGEISNYAIRLDAKMKDLGFKRVSANELVVDTQIQKVFIYEAMAIE